MLPGGISAQESCGSDDIQNQIDDDRNAGAGIICFYGGAVFILLSFLHGFGQIDQRDQQGAGFDQSKTIGKDCLKIHDR